MPRLRQLQQRFAVSDKQALGNARHFVVALWGLGHRVLDIVGEDRGGPYAFRDPVRGRRAHRAASDDHDRPRDGGGRGG